MLKVMTVEVREMPLTLREAETLLIVSAGGTLPAAGARLGEAMVLMGRGLVVAVPTSPNHAPPYYEAGEIHRSGPSTPEQRWQATARGHALAVALLEKAVS